ncbi:PilZ domain-containing protein [Aureimonas mangrovi]|uniref:PilZ domain-containing protein n=1 Tax=Aureimonas mangrovi TaxID=2758041 RepID=UPI00163D5668|nr:PilZ domain-containing protein [Aureimonas mangrovi]
MQASETLLDRPAAFDERRHFQRVNVDLLGRFMLENRAEYPCRIENMSPGDLAALSPVSPRVGERVILYVDHVGRIEAAVSRLFAGGFAATVRASDRKREKLAAQLTWLANRHELNLPEDRRHERMAPRNPVVELALEDERRYRATIIDLSLSGAAVSCQVRPAIGTRIMLGTTLGRVVRHLEDGIAVEFARVGDGEALASRTD